MQGTVKWFNNKKGYGFITGEDDNDIFAHYSGITGDGFKKLKSGDSVQFDIEEYKDGKKAINVTVLKEG